MVARGLGYFILVFDCNFYSTRLDAIKEKCKENEGKEERRKLPNLDRFCHWNSRLKELWKN